MQLCQISQIILLLPNLDWQLICCIDSISKNIQVLISLAAICSLLIMSLKMLRCWLLWQPFLTHAISILNQRCFYLSSDSLFSVSVSLSCLPISPAGYLSPFHINTQQIWCLTIIDHNKLIEATMLFHLRGCTQYLLDLFLTRWNLWSIEYKQNRVGSKWCNLTKRMKNVCFCT
jgi:hypothetical protein